MITITADQIRNQAATDQVMREAQASNGTVKYWDEDSDPCTPGWVIRTYSTVDGESTYTEDVV